MHFAGGLKATEDEAEIEIYQSLDISNLRVYIEANDRNGSTTVTLRKNETDTALTVTIGASSTGEFEDSDSVSFSNGDTADHEITVGGTSGAIEIDCISCLFEDSTNHVKYLVGNRGSTLTPSDVYYYSIGALPARSTTETDVYTTVRQAYTIDKARIYLDTNSITAASYYKSRVNEADGNISITITASTTGEFEDASGSDSLSAGDEFCFELTAGGSGTELKVVLWQCRSSHTSDHILVSNYETPTFDYNDSDYVTPMEGYPFWHPASTNYDRKKMEVRGASGSVTIKNPCLTVSANDMNGAGTFKYRINGVNGSNISITITASTTGIFEDTSNTETLSNGDYITPVVSGSGSSGTCQIAVIKTEISGYTSTAEYERFAAAAMGVVGSPDRNTLFERSKTGAIGAVGTPGRGVTLTRFSASAIGLVGATERGIAVTRSAIGAITEAAIAKASYQVTRFAAAAMGLVGVAGRGALFTRTVSILQKLSHYPIRQMIAEYLLDESAGATVPDTSLKQNNGSQSGCDWVTGRIGNALQFIEAADNVNFGNLSDHDIHNTGGSLELWFKHDGEGGETQILVARSGMKISLNTNTGKVKVEYPCSVEGIEIEA